jgi:hypothetical protein
MTPENTLQAAQRAYSAPTRIQRRRSKGWKMPENSIYVGRGSKWGNQFVIQIAPKGMVGAYPQTDNRYAVVDTRTDAPRGNYKLFPTFFDAARYAVTQFRNVQLRDILREDPDALQELTGSHLACWCAESNPCHGDLLLELANRLGIEA